MSIPKRVLLDSKEIQNDEYREEGIYYWINEANCMTGKILIWGLIGSLYEDMPMIYSTQFPPEYPFEPPKVLFLTNDGYTRFHPNMYKEGKVCLSILGTWEGPKWAATLRLSTAALSIQSLMDNNPIVHEPGYEKRNDIYTNSYNEFIGYQCLKYVISIIEHYAVKGKVPLLLSEFEEEFLERLPKIIERMRSKLDKVIEDKLWVHIPYSMTGQTDYATLKQRFISACQKIDIKTS